MKIFFMQKLLIFIFISIGLCSSLDITNRVQPQRSLELKITDSNLPNLNAQSDSSRKMPINENPFSFGLGSGVFQDFKAARPVENENSPPKQSQPNEEVQQNQPNQMPNSNSMLPLMMASMMMSGGNNSPFGAQSSMPMPQPNMAMRQPMPSDRYVEVDDDGLPEDDNGFDFGASVDLLTEVYDDASGVRVINKCKSVKAQAVEIANRIMKKQNTKIYKELISYLIKSKFLIGMTEIKIARALRKRIFSLMGAFSTLNHDQFNFINPFDQGIEKNLAEKSNEAINKIFEEPHEKKKQHKEKPCRNNNRNSNTNEDTNNGFVPTKEVVIEDEFDDEPQKAQLDKSFADKTYPDIDNFIRNDVDSGFLKSLKAKI